MNNSFLESIGINSADDLATILEQLEEKQLEYFERLENVSDSKREEELQQILAQIETETEAVKEELNAVKTAIIVDNPEEGKKEKKDKKEKSVKEKNPDLKKDIEKMKGRAQKEKETKAQQEKAADASEQKKETEKSSDDTPAKNTQKETTKKKEAAPQQTELSKALHCYQNKDYTSAFRKFTELGEQKKDPVAQLMLARMYENGEGVAASEDRAIFWYRSSADRGNVDAQYAYAIKMLAKKNGTTDNTNTKIGMSYLEKAADQNYQAAIDRYIELSLQDGSNLQWLSKAIALCDRGKNVVQGSYEKEQYQKKKKELEDKKKNISKAKNVGNLPTVVSICGNLLYMVSFLYLFWGMHPYYASKIALFEKLPEAAEKYIIPWQAFRDWATAEEFLSVNGMLGIEILLIAATLSSIGAVGSRKKIAHKLVPVVVCVAIGMSIWHIYAWHETTQYLTQYAGKSFIAFAGTIVVGCIIGNICKSVFKIK